MHININKRKYTTKKGLAYLLDPKIEEEAYSAMKDDEESVRMIPEKKPKLKMPIVYNTLTPDTRFSYLNKKIKTNLKNIDSKVFIKCFRKVISFNKES